MIIDTRSALQTALDDPDATILVLKPPAEGVRRDLHDEAVQAVEAQPWRRTFLLKKLSILTAAERDAWFSADAAYCVLGGGAPKVVGPSGPEADLLLADGTVSRLKIRSRFAQGDQL